MQVDETMTPTTGKASKQMSANMFVWSAYTDKSALRDVTFWGGRGSLKHPNVESKGN